jgi:hypothetical protein
VRLYLAGPMTGHPENNYPAFHAAARRLRSAGFVVLNPAETILPPLANPTWGDWMRAGLTQLLTTDGVALLPASGGSRGAQLEVLVAHELAMPVRTIPWWLTKAGQDAYMIRLGAGNVRP